jgi:HAD superfamily hydrolase (TIGR01549 family)
LAKNTILFDLGGTLAYYYDMSGFQFILRQAINAVQLYLDEKGLLRVTPEIIALRVRDEDHESSDYSSRPLEERLTRIFSLDASTTTPQFLKEICQHFMRPIFARGRCFEDTLPALEELRSSGFRAAIVSNTSWGSPAALWRAEIRRLGLYSYMDAVVLDRDVGWRKPSERIFKSALKTLRASPAECLFVGDEPKWDLEGPRAIGIDAVLIDRKGVMPVGKEEPIKSLNQLRSMV